MLKGHDFRAAHIILLAVAINALAVTLWLALTNIIPSGITPGSVTSYGIPAGTVRVGGLGAAVLWLALFAVAGMLVAGRMVVMRWVRVTQASVDRPEVGRRMTPGPRWQTSHTPDRAAGERARSSQRP